MLLGFWILGMIVIVCVGVWLAKDTQYIIDSKNAQARLDRAFKIAKEREDKNNGWNEWTTLWNNR